MKPKLGDIPFRVVSGDYDDNDDGNAAEGMVNAILLSVVIWAVIGFVGWMVLEAME